VTHYRMHIVDSATGSIRHENSSTIYRNLEQALDTTATTARTTAALMSTPERKVTAQQSADPGEWLIEWIDEAGQSRSRIVSIVASDEPLELRSADTGADSA
jgi:hypothetical protein